MNEESSRAEAAASVGLSPELLKLLVCPIDKADLVLDGQALVCAKCQRRYPIEDGIPNMLVDDDQ